MRIFLVPILLFGISFAVIPAQPARAIAAFFASGFGADLTGASDSTASIQACLDAAGVVDGTCQIDPGGKIKLLGAIRVPRHTELNCGLTVADSEEVPAGFALLPAIMLDTTQTISAGGVGAAIDHCLIYRNGMNFPAADSSAYTGVAVSAAGQSNFTMRDDVVLGFDTCIDAYGANRIYLEHDYLDCNGAANGALRTGGNTDGGFIKDLKIQPLGTGNGSCTGSMRDGTGWKLQSDSGEFADKIVVQNFKQQDVWWNLSGGTMVGSLWVDDLGAVIPGCVGLKTVGIKIDRPNAIHISHLDVNSAYQGLVVTSVSPWSTVHIGDLFLNQVENDCVVLGGAGTPGGQLTIDFVGSNQAAPIVCGRYAFNYADTTGLSTLRIYAGSLTKTNGGATPYVNVAAPIAIGAQLQIGHISSDLPPGAPLIGGSALGCVQIASAAMLNLSGHADCWTVTGTTSITALGGVWGGRELTLIFTRPLTLTNGNNIALADGRDFVTAKGSLIRLFCYAPAGGAVCKEIARSR
jgi:hypothetical protein